MENTKIQSYDLKSENVKKPKSKTKTTIEPQVQPYMDFGSNSYWSNIKYSKSNFIENSKILQRLDHKELNLLRTNLKEQYGISKVFITLNNITCLSLQHENYIFDDIYNLLANKDLLYEALGRIKRNKGIFTKGSNEETIDTVTNNTIEDIAKKIKTNSYLFNPVKRVYIPKAGKAELRPLGIPTISDRILQQAMRMILECIYEPIFEKLNVSYGYRPGMGCHNNIALLKVKGQAKRTAIEGDIKGAFDNVKFDILIKILSKKIKDKKFLNLILKLLKSGIMENGKFSETKTGTPQGGIISPILFNIYMHEFDLFIENDLRSIIQQKNISENRVDKPESKTYKRVRYQRDKLIKEYREIEQQAIANQNFDTKPYKKKIREMSLFLTELTYTNYDKKTIEFTYTRYADDWIILSNCDTEYAETIKDTISNWLTNNLSLTLSENKTKITDIKQRPTTPAKFLGFSLKINNSNKIIKLSKDPFKRYERVTGWSIQVTPDYQRIFQKLEREGFCNKKYEPICKNTWTVLYDFEIIGRFIQKMFGYYNYYLPMCNELDKLNRIHYILYYSCLFTLGRKFKTKITKFFNKKGEVKITFDARFNVSYPFVEMDKQSRKEFNKILNKQSLGEQVKIEKNQYTKTITLPKQLEVLNKSIESTKDNYKTIKRGNSRPIYIPIFRTSDQPEDYLGNSFINWRTAYKMTKCCSICGSTTNVENHHIQHIKKGKVIGFQQVLKQLNRKQIQVCKQCHLKIHKGEYDGINLSDFYDPKDIIL
jgi:nicotine oxidoreductase